MKVGGIRTGRREGDSWPLTARMLAFAAGGSPDTDWQALGHPARQFAWVLQGGLGPLLRWAASAAHAVPPTWAQTLLAAELTARVRHGSLVDTALDVLRVCREVGAEPTLLKGISVSDQLYPAEHMRPMSDVDVLLAAADYPKVEAGLLDCGFVRLPYPEMKGHHHGAPLRHERRRTLVELHTALFPASAQVHGGTLFAAGHLEAEKRASAYHGEQACRLSNEVQLAYIAAAWFDDMATGRFHPSFLASLFDAVFLLRAHGPTLDWDRLVRWIGDDMAKASLYAMLTYATRFGTKPPPAHVLDHLADNGGLVGPIQRRLIHAALDRHLIGARPWSLPFPPPMPGRYSPRHQLRKRIGFA
jgi:hypothetical protein